MLYSTSTSLICLALGLAAGQSDQGSGVSGATYTSCGVTHTLSTAPSRAVTMNQGVTEMMLAMGLQDRMAGTAYIDDAIWPRYATAYAGVPVLSSSYPTEAQIMGVNADFILGSYRSAFRQRTCTPTRCRGIFNETIGPCDGENSDFFPAGSNSTTSYSTCRPQLHAAGIGTWLEPVSCEDSALNPQGGATEETVYAAIRQIGNIFNVAPVAEQLIADVRNDFAIAEQTVAASGASLKAVWLDCIGCCSSQGPEYVFIGAGSGAPNLIMQEAGLTNVFAGVDASWSCQNITTILAAAPDVMVIVDAAWDSAISKIDYIHNHTGLCSAPFVQRADYITIPFSASTLGPRNGAAALDMVAAAIHVTTGNTMMNFESGVTFMDPELLRNRTAGLLCPVNLDEVVYSSENAPTSAASNTTVVTVEADASAPIALIAVLVVVIILFLAVAIFACTMYRAEKNGEPIFYKMSDNPSAKKSSTELGGVAAENAQA